MEGNSPTYHEVPDRMRTAKVTKKHASGNLLPEFGDERNPSAHCLEHHSGLYPWPMEFHRKIVASLYAAIGCV